MNRLTALQRGLGRGFLRAQKAGRAAQRDILTCVLSDPRWDRQVDDRAEYYSQLMISTQASWRAVESYLKEFAISPELDYLDRVLVLEVLAQAAWRGQEEPGRLLARYLGEPLLLEDIRGAVYKIGGEELVSRVLGPAQLGWIDVTPPEHAPEPPVSAGTPISTLLPRLEGQAPRAAEAVGERASVEELLRYRESAGLHGYHKVMKLLGQRGYSELLQEAAQALQRSDLKPMQRRAYIDYLVALPASATLRLARSWLNHPQLARAGELIMARRAEPEDFALLIESGRRALDAENQMAVC